MNKNDLYLAIGHVDEKLLERSEKSAAKKHAPKVVQILSVAAVICLMLGGTAFLGSAGILTYDLFFRGAGAPAPNDIAEEQAYSQGIKDEIDDELSGDTMIPAEGENASQNGSREEAATVAPEKAETGAPEMAETGAPEKAETGAPEAAKEGSISTEAKEDEAFIETQTSVQKAVEPIQITFMITLAGFGLGVVLLILVLILKSFTRRRKKLDPSGHI